MTFKVGPTMDGNLKHCGDSLQHPHVHQSGRLPRRLPGVVSCPVISEAYPCSYLPPVVTYQWICDKGKVQVHSRPITRRMVPTFEPRNPSQPWHQYSWQKEQGACATSYRTLFSPADINIFNNHSFSPRTVSYIRVSPASRFALSLPPPFLFFSSSFYLRGGFQQIFILSLFLQFSLLLDFPLFLYFRYFYLLVHSVIYSFKIVYAWLFLLAI